MNMLATLVVGMVGGLRPNVQSRMVCGGCAVRPRAGGVTGPECFGLFVGGAGGVIGGLGWLVAV
jgi:hypothetical protein